MSSTDRRVLAGRGVGNNSLSPSALCLVAAWLCGGLAPTVCRAQATTAASSASRAAIQRRVSSSIRPACSPLPPSTVSGAIASFVDDSVRKLPVGSSSAAAQPGAPGAPEPRGRRVALTAPRRCSARAPASPTAVDRSPREAAIITGTLPPGELPTLNPAPTEATDRRFPINLATELRLSDARPLVVAAAQASVWMAEADLKRARLLWVPSLLFGADYIRHEGGGPDVNKGIMTAPSVNYFYAGPSLYQFVNLTDAYFEPLVARQSLNAAHWDIQSQKNDALLTTADAYFRVHQQRGLYAGALYTVERGRDLVDRIAQLSRSSCPSSRWTAPGIWSPISSSGP